MSRTVANRIAALYPGRSLQGYIRWKIRYDPLYAGVREILRDTELPIVDVGCGIGLLAQYLRDSGLPVPIVGVDFDDRKIALAQRAAADDGQMRFVVGDARDPFPAGHQVVILDILHYFDSASQQRILRNAAAAAPPGGLVVIRQGLRDRSWRYRITAAVDAIGRAIRWMRADALNYPTREDVMGPFAGFTCDAKPLWGGTPYNNYLFVFRRNP